jgi:hypothetical protein
MRWQVHGADARTGNEVVVTIDAPTVDAAEDEARRMGLLVAAVKGAVARSAADRLAEMVGEPRREASSVPSPALLDYRGVPTSARPSAGALRVPQVPVVPNYIGLQLAAIVLFSFALLGYVFAVVQLMIGGAVLMSATRGGNSAGGVIGFLFSLSMALAPAIFAALLHGLAAICVAVRDIARNSFRPVVLPV